MTNLHKIDGDTITRATQIATGALKAEWCDLGRKLRDFSTSDHRKAIGDYIREHPEVLERAAIEVAEWRKKGLLRRTRRTVDFIELLRR
jgi:hypothetical protein